MGKKVNLNKPNTSNNSIKKNNHSSYHRNSSHKSNFNIASQTSINSTSSVEQRYEIEDKAKITIKMPIIIKFVLPAIMIIIPLIALCFFVVIFGSEAQASTNGKYAYYDGACTEVSMDSNFMSIEEYVEVIMSTYDNNYSEEALKAFAVAVRTNIIETSTVVEIDSDECYYEVTGSEALYNNEITDEISFAVNETNGLIATVDGNPTGHYDESCVYTAAKAMELEPSGTYGDDFYYIKYGELTVGGINFHAIHKPKANVGTLSYYGSLAESGDMCAENNNGYGLSINGAMYLEKYNGADWEAIINYYYNDSAEIMSINEGYSSEDGGYTGNVPLNPGNSMYVSSNFLIGQSFSSFLQSKGSSVEALNAKIKSEVEAAGVGTRSGVVTAAVTLIGSLADMGIKLNYQWGGKYATLGTNPNWGTEVNMNWLCGPESYGTLYDSAECFANYRWSSFDCSGFVTWAVINGMQNTSITQSQIKGSPATSLDPNQAVCKVGGMLESPGHIVLIVGIDEANKNYIVAESRGSDISTGEGGVILSNYAFGRPNYNCLNLDEIYGD